MLILLYSILNFVFKAIEILIIIRIVLSWIIPYYSRNEFMQTIYAITEPILAPLRIVIPVGNMRFDLAPIAAFFIIRVLRTVVLKILFELYL